MLTLIPPDIPANLDQLPQPVNKLHIVGKTLDDLLQRPRIAIVGSRKFSPYGRGVTESLTAELARKGVVIVSGLALGTDSIAHQACLDTGGQTIAVVANGLDYIYPISHTNLARNIVEKGGVIISEYELGHKPYRYDFLARNRIIAALSDGVLLTEAAIRSGSLNTANHALELGKPVFAVPGNITNPLSAGTNNLIKAGAIPVTCADDILNALNWQELKTSNKKVVGDTDEEILIIRLLEQGFSDGAELLLKSELEASVFNQTLIMLEITGKVRPLGANNWSL